MVKMYLGGASYNDDSDYITTFLGDEILFCGLPLRHRVSIAQMHYML